MSFSEKKKIFNYCPSCGTSDIFFDDVKEFSCRKCSFSYYHNVAAAVALIIEYDGKIVLIRRNEEPGRGKLDLPGGFIDPGETAEEAIIREIKEELRIDIGTLKYLGSYPNKYEFKGVQYNTCDLFFYSKINELPTDFDKTEVMELVLKSPSEVQDEEIAFESTKTGLALFGKNL